MALGTTSSKYRLSTPPLSPKAQGKQPERRLSPSTAGLASSSTPTPIPLIKQSVAKPKTIETQQPTAESPMTTGIPSGAIQPISVENSSNPTDASCLDQTGKYIKNNKGLVGTGATVVTCLTTVGVLLCTGVI